MLSDRERQALNELESQLSTEDFQLGNSSDARAQRAGSKFLNVLAGAAIVLAAMVIALVLLVTGSVGVALGVTAGAVLVWGCWRSIKNSQGTHEPH